MSKYDCTRTLDYVHERSRLCKSYTGCEECPLSPGRCANFTPTEEHIAIVQQWSDTHPEMPKLTREEHDFLASFMFPDKLIVRKGEVTMQLDTDYSMEYPNATIPLKKSMFQFIEYNENWTVERLLKLEVQDD